MTGEAAAGVDDRLDLGGWVQLGLMVLLGAGIAVVVGVLIDGPFPWVTVVVIGVALAVVLPVAQLRRWWSRGGRSAVVETGSWLRSGRVPEEVPDAVWRPRVRQLEDETTGRLVSAWGAAVVTLLWAGSALDGDGADWALVVVWAVVATVGLVGSYRRRGAARRLLSARDRVVSTD